MGKTIKRSFKVPRRLFVAILLGAVLIGFGGEIVVNAQIQQEVEIQEVQPFQTTTRTETHYFRNRNLIPTTISSNAHGFAGTLHLVRVVQMGHNWYQATFSGTVHWIGFH